MADELFCSTVAATAYDVPDRVRGSSHLILAWVTPGSNEADEIKRQLAKHGWKVDEVKDAKRVPSSDPAWAPSTPVGRALAEARTRGFAFLVHSQRPG
jgi:hypothetical protein